MANGINPYQLAQSYIQPQKERQKLAQDERSSIGFEANYKKKMAKELESVLDELKRQYDRRRRKHRGRDKFLNFAAELDPTGLVQGGADTLRQQDEADALKKLLMSNTEFYKNSFLEPGILDYNKDISASIRDLRKTQGKTFFESALTDFVGKKIGGRTKVSDIGDMWSGFKDKFKKGFTPEVKKIGGELTTSTPYTGKDSIMPVDVEGFPEKPLEEQGLLKRLFSGLKEGGTFLEDYIKELKDDKEGQKKLISLLSVLGDQGYDIDVNWRDYFK